MKILLAVDGSDYTKRMLGYIAAHDELLGARHTYCALTCIPGVPQRAARYLSKADIDEYYRDEAEHILAPIRAFAEQNKWNLSAEFRHGHVSEVLADFAQSQHCDLIVMGTHGHSPMGSVVLGSVSTGVLARTKIPVLLIR